MPEVQILRTTTRRLPVHLTDEQKLIMGHDLAATVQEAASEVEAQKTQKEQMKAKLSELAARAARLSSIIASGTEYLDVEVEVRLGAAEVQVVRLDTGEVVERRPPSDQERQQRLELEEEPDAT